MKKELEALEAAIKAAQATSIANQAKKEEPKKEAPEEEYPAEITIDDFCKVQLKVGEVIESKEVPKSKKLLRNVVKFGERKESSSPALRTPMHPMRWLASVLWLPITSNPENDGRNELRHDSVCGRQGRQAVYPDHR